MRLGRNYTGTVFPRELCHSLGFLPSMLLGGHLLTIQGHWRIIGSRSSSNMHLTVGTIAEKLLTLKKKKTSLIYNGPISSDYSANKMSLYHINIRRNYPFAYLHEFFIFNSSSCVFFDTKNILFLKGFHITSYLPTKILISNRHLKQFKTLGFFFTFVFHSIFFQLPKKTPTSPQDSLQRSQTPIIVLLRCQKLPEERLRWS